MSDFTFGVVDYVLFVLLLLVSSGVGVYFGFFGNRVNTTAEYLLGGNRMQTIPVGISLVASQITAISFIAIPAEIYSFGVTEMFSAFSMFVCVPFLCYISTPIFYNNHISNCYEYLELRFDKRTRVVMTAIFIITVMLSMPVYIFLPALAFAQVTGINIHLVNAVVCFTCVFYTMLGGIKAVVWTDAFQGAIMLGSAILVAVVAISHIGGFESVLKYNSEGGRFQVRTKFDLTTRSTVWNIVIGYSFMWTGLVGFYQSNVQRVIALPSLGHAKRSLVIFGLGYILIGFLSHILGLILFAAYHDCDPVKAGVVSRVDKLMPFLVQNIVGHLAGLPGVFVSAVFSASLSTMSASLNSLSGIVYFDYIKPFIKHTESRANLIMKAVVFIAGLTTFLGGLLVDKFKFINQLLVSIHGLTHGAIFGTFTLGMFVPRAHSTAGFYGMMFSLVVMVWIVVGGQIKTLSGGNDNFVLPTRVDGCDAHNISVANSMTPNTTFAPYQDTGSGFSPYAISFHWYKPIGAICVWIVAIPLAFLTTPSEEKRVNEKLLVPIVRRFLPPEPRLPEEVPLNETRFYGKSNSKRAAPPFVKKCPVNNL